MKWRVPVSMVVELARRQLELFRKQRGSGGGHRVLLLRYRLTSNTIGSSSKVVISTIQRLYSILKGEPDLDPEAEEHTSMDDDPWHLGWFWKHPMRDLRTSTVVPLIQ